jgi:DNA-binding MarR family transcriptional regulator
MPTAVATSGLASGLRMSVMRLARRLRAERSDTSLSITQIAALATLERDGPLSPGELAMRERVQPPSMTRIVAELASRGLVVREPHPTDGRQARLTVSAAGAELLRADRRRREAWLVRRLAELSEEERAVLRAAAPLLDRLARS